MTREVPMLVSSLVCVAVVVGTVGFADSTESVVLTR
jgi:hypothetical protein